MARDIQFRELTSYLILLCLNTVWRNVSIWKEVKKRKDINILDAGYGKHSHISKIVEHYKFTTTGLDIFEPNVRETKKSGIYQDVIVGDIRRLPFKDKEFDLVVCIEVIEHAEKEDGEKMLAELERVCKWLVLVTTPIGISVHHAYGGNPFEEHRYIWSLQELSTKGFRMRGKGIKGITAGDKWWLSLPMLIRPFQYAIYIGGTLFSYFIPAIAESVVAWKRLE